MHRNEQKKKSIKVAEAVPESETAAPVAQEMKENPIESDPMETGTDESTAILSALPTITRQRIVTKSEPVFVMAQEGIDGVP